MNAIEVKNLTKYYGDKKAVDDISFTVKSGEIFGYLGPNGAGKSTTINCMMNFIFPTSGTILLNGKDTREQHYMIREEIGYLSSDVSLYQDRTGRDHFQMIESVRGKSKMLPKLIKEYEFNPDIIVKHLSLGNKQKLAIIMAFMHRPKLLLLDEPTRGLDPLFQNLTYEYLLEFRSVGTTIFMSSHNLGEVDKLCDNIGIIKFGKLQTVETIDSIKQKSIYQIHIHTTEDAKIEAMKEVANVMKNIDGSYNFKYKGDIKLLMKKLEKIEISDLEITHASLEDLFMEYYK